MPIIYNIFCCFGASAYTTFDRLCAVFFYIICAVLEKYHDVYNRLSVNLQPVYLVQVA